VPIPLAKGIEAYGFPLSILIGENDRILKKSLIVIIPIQPNSVYIYTTWKVDGATPMYWFIITPY